MGDKIPLVFSIEIFVEFTGEQTIIGVIPSASETPPFFFRLSLFDGEIFDLTEDEESKTWV